MSYNGSGTFNINTAGQPVVAGTTITDTAFNALTADLATGLTNAITRDGQSPATANIPMGSNKITGLAAASANGDAVRYEQLPSATNPLPLASTTGIAGSGANADITSLTGLTTPVSLIVLRSYLAGCTLSTAGSSATMSIAAGAAMDSTNAYLMQLAAIAKTTSAWAVGTAAGGLDTGAIANSTWYHFYVIRRPDTGVVDVTFSTNATTPTLPTNYTQYRRIGAGKTNGSAQWVSFTQDGDYFRLAASVRDINTNNPGTAAVTATLASVPTGVNVQAIFNYSLENNVAGTVTSIYFSDLAATDEAPSLTNAPFGNAPETIASAGGVGFAMGSEQIRTNTSAQIRYRVIFSDANVNVRIGTLGWIDSRGRNA